jgi:hypothetical protein
MTDAITAKAPGFKAKVAVILGSGLGAFADEVAPVAAIPYGELPGFPQTTVGSHAGRLVLGHVGPTPVAVLQGRAHYYERGKADEMRGAPGAGGLSPRSHAGMLLLGQDGDDQVRGHLGVEVDQDVVVADSLDAAFEVDPPTVHDDALFLEGISDLGGGDGAVQRLGVTRPLADLDAGTLDRRGHLLRLVELFRGFGFEPGPLLFEDPDVPLGGLEGQAVGQQEVPGEAGLDLHDLATLAQVSAVFEKDHFHRHLSSLG